MQYTRAHCAARRLRRCRASTQPPNTPFHCPARRSPAAAGIPPFHRGVVEPVELVADGSVYRLQREEGLVTQRQQNARLDRADGIDDDGARPARDLTTATASLFVEHRGAREALHDSAPLAAPRHMSDDRWSHGRALRVNRHSIRTPDRRAKVGNYKDRLTGAGSRANVEGWRLHFLKTFGLGSARKLLSSDFAGSLWR